MDKIILSIGDVQALLSWRDQNKDLIRRNAAPFKAIMLQFTEAKIDIKAYNNAGKIAFYVLINGHKAGKISARQLPGGMLQVTKNTTKLQSGDIQSIITVYASLCAFIVYHVPEAAPAAERRQDRQHKKRGKGKKQRRREAITYILKSGDRGPYITRRGQHRSPAGTFTVRGHYRHYKDGRAVWIAPYTKGKGDKKNKIYKMK
jgi:hypothetical protein